MPPDRARFDINNIHTVTAVSSSDGVSPVILWADPTTHALLTSGGGGGGGGNVNITQVGSSNITLGQKTMANSFPVTLASDQSALPVSLTSTTITSIVPGAGATNLGKAEDAVHSSGDTGVMALAVRSDSDTPLASDGDYIPLITNQFGRLKSSVLPAATAITTGTIITGTGTVQVDTTRQSGATMQITGTFSAFNGIFEGSLDGGATWEGLIAARSNSNTAETTTGLISGDPGYFWKISANNLTHVRLRATALTSGSVVASFMPTAFASDPVPVAQRTRRDVKVQQYTTITSSTAETTVLTSVANTFLDVYGVAIANTSSTASEVVFKDATGGTNRFSIMVPAGATQGFMLPSNDAYNQSVAANNWTATAGTSVASLKITMFAVKIT